MSVQVTKIELENFEIVANSIIKVAKMVKTTSGHFRNSYLFECKSSEVKAIRTDVFNNAIVYNSKIVPFIEETIANIKGFCNMIRSRNYDYFKNNLKIITKNAKTNEEICEYAYLFHVCILTDFKKFEDNIIKLTLEQNLINKYMSPETAIELMNPIISPTLGNTNQEPQDSLRDVLKPLMNSISDYIGSLKTITGFFKNLHSDLTTFNNNKNDDELFLYFHMISKSVQTILDACTNYFNTVGRISSNIEFINEEPNKIYIDTWILNVVKNRGKDKDLRELVKEKENLKKICGLSLT